MIGEKIRQTRVSQSRSLADVARRAKISVATLSRIENDKQTLDVGLFLTLARVLDTPATELLGGSAETEAGSIEPLVRKIAAIEARERTRLWRELAAAERAQKSNARGADVRHVAQQVEELLAQIDFIRQELEVVRKRLRRARG